MDEFIVPWIKCTHTQTDDENAIQVGKEFYIYIYGNSALPYY